MKDYNHEKELIYEAVGLTEEQHDEALDRVKTMLIALAKGKKKSEAVKEIEKIFNKGNSRENAYSVLILVHFFDDQLEKIATKSLLTSAFMSKEEKEKKQNKQKPDLPDDVKRGYI